MNNKNNVCKNSPHMLKLFDFDLNVNKFINKRIRGRQSFILLLGIIKTKGIQAIA